MAIVHIIRESVGEFSSVAFDEHAIARMQERGVTEDEVLDVLSATPIKRGSPRRPDANDTANESGTRAGSTWCSRKTRPRSSSSR